MKKLISVVCLICSLFCISLSSAFAAEKDCYEQVLNKVNEAYGTNLGYVKVNESEISLEDYTNLAKKIAADQRRLLDYLESKENEMMDISENEAALYSTITKTRTKPTWSFPSNITITATYNVYDGVRVSSAWGARLGLTAGGYLNTQILNESGPSYSLLDGGRTAGVKYTATVKINGATFSNSTLYTEFGAGD